MSLKVFSPPRKQINGKKVIIGIPMYNHRLVFGTLNSAFVSSAGRHRVRINRMKSSMLARNHNWLFYFALRAHLKGECDYYVNLHSDVVPEQFFVDKLIDEMETAGADILGVVVPFSDGSGITSIAIDNPDDPWEPKHRLTVHDCKKLPPTFSQADTPFPNNLLLVNTGCTIFKLRSECFHVRDLDGNPRVWFTIKDRVSRIETKDNPDGWTFSVETIPEDWGFSRDIQKYGAKVCATTAVRVLHYAEVGFGFPEDQNATKTTLEDAIEEIGVGTVQEKSEKEHPEK